MNLFNLIISTAREFEKQAECELWFHLLALGDETPIIRKIGIAGLLTAKTCIDPHKIIKYFQEIHQKDPDIIQFIQKIIPIDSVVASEVNLIKEAVIILLSSHPYVKDPTSSYRITVRKRITPLKTDEIINALASEIHHPVSLKNYAWNLQIEVIGQYTGIAIITPQDVFSPCSQESINSKVFQEEPFE